MPLRICDTDDILPEDTNIPSVLQYDASAGRFRLKNVIVNSSILTSSVIDSVLPDSFIAQIEDEVDTDNITTRNYDGGSF